MRALQFLPYLQQHDVRVTVAPFFDDATLGRYYREQRRPSVSVAASYRRRALAMLRARRFDAVWLEKEALPFAPAWLENWSLFRAVPVLADFDDAIFHGYDRHKSKWIRKVLGQKIAKIMRAASLVTVGSEYLYNYAKQSGAHSIELLPTVVDTNRYTPAKELNRGTVRIGWIGTPATTKYLRLIKGVIDEIADNRAMKLVLVGANNVDAQEFRAEARPWSEGAEVRDIQSFDIGIMPLPDADWERGKCAYKLIQYMACGVPVVASPVGANVDVVRRSGAGFLASSLAEWREALGALHSRGRLHRQMAIAGRQFVEREFSTELIAPKLLRLLRGLARSV